ncbi:hypothetical protein LWI28_019367 [Acer negundo]|uniref:Rx N-terminal domain-containing protein n=1 Tax=Acer negundo TaxID=4023 RepID=A0AAD5J6D0_ACENE|nr:hypothetical protein LWI28_019367 [Acer negundo]
MADIAVSAALVLVEEVFSLLEREANLKKDLRDDFQKIRDWLSTVQACLQRMDGKEGDEIIQKDCVRQVRDLAYEIEDVLDEFKIHVPRKFHRHRLSKIRKLLHDFKLHLLVYHYNVKKYVIFDSAQGVDVPAGVQGLSAIQKLSLIQVNKHRKIIVELKFLVELRKLGLIGLKREDGRELCASIQKMQKLSTLDVRSSYKEEYLELDDMDDNPPSLLQRLYLKGLLRKFPEWVSSLDSLVRIGLKWSRLETSPLEALQALPNLVELEMVDSYTGNVLEFIAETFKELKFLHLEQINKLNTVIVEEKAMPKLRKLTICKCEKMEMLPLGISNLTQLQELLVYDMHKNFVERLQKNSEDRCMIDHIPVIHSFTSEINQFWSLQNFS